MAARRHITTAASEYDTADDLAPNYEQDQGYDLSLALPTIKLPRQGETRLATASKQRCDARPRRVLRDGRPLISEGFTQDVHEEEMKQRKLMERVRELASTDTN